MTLPRTLSKRTSSHRLLFLCLRISGWIRRRGKPKGRYWRHCLALRKVLLGTGPSTAWGKSSPPLGLLPEGTLSMKLLAANPKRKEPRSSRVSALLPSAFSLRQMNFTDIVKAFKRSLSHVDWMDKKSAKAASNKADAIRIKVGFPVSPDTRSAESIASYYRLVEIDENKFFQNILNAT